jgi:hypothetical protein
VIVGSGIQGGPQWICDRCNWSGDWCTCHPHKGRFLRRPGDTADVEWRRERTRTLAVNRQRDPNRNQHATQRKRILAKSTRRKVA